MIGDCLSLKFHSRPQVHPVSFILLNRSYQLMNLQKHQLDLSEFKSFILRRLVMLLQAIILLIKMPWAVSLN